MRWRIYSFFIFSKLCDFTAGNPDGLLTGIYPKYGLNFVAIKGYK